MSENAASLRRLLDQIFADAVVDPKERETLATARAQLPTNEVMDVFVEFLSDKWGEAYADGRITPFERSLLLRIVGELNLVATDLPLQARMALGEAL